MPRVSQIVFWAGVSLAAIPARGSAQALKLVPVATFGCDDCNTPFLFASLQSITVTSTGNVIVADQTEPRLRVFDSHGRLVRSLGKTGKGPGEVSTSNAVTISASGDYEIVDQIGRITQVDASARETGTLKVGGFITSANVGPSGHGVLFAVTRPGESSLKIQALSEMKVQPRLEVLQTFFPLRSDILTVPFAVAADGTIAVGDGMGEYSIKLWGPDGTRKFDIRRQVARVKKTAAQVEAEEEMGAKFAADMQRMIAATAGSGKPGSRPKSANTGKPVQRVKPSPAAEAAAAPEGYRDFFSYSALQFDDAGRLWVQVERGRDGETVFDVFDKTGRYLNELRVDAKVVQYNFGGGVMAAITESDLGIQKIRTWTIATTPASK